jgi:hypothetical protein
MVIVLLLYEKAGEIGGRGLQNICKDIFIKRKRKTEFII